MEVIKLHDWVVYLSEYSHPTTLVVEVSTRCNLACIHCFRYAAKHFKLVDMPYENFVKIVDNAVASGVRRLVLTGWGEPTANPRILDMVKYAKNKGLYVVLNTNGVMLRELGEAIVDVGVDELYVSIDAVDVELYEKIRVHGEFSTVSKGIALVSEIKQHRSLRKPVIKSIYTVSKLNLKQLIKLVGYATEIGIQEVYVSMYIHHEAGVPGIDCINNKECIEELKAIFGEVAKIAINAPVKLWIPNTESYTDRGCPYAESRALYVRADGKVAPCMFLAYTWRAVIDGIKRDIFEHVIGDALSESLLDVWRRNAKMLFKLAFNHMPSCLDCTLRNWCSYTQSTGFDCWGNTPNCSFCPYHYKMSYCPL